MTCDGRGPATIKLDCEVPGSRIVPARKEGAHPSPPFSRRCREFLHPIHPAAEEDRSAVTHQRIRPFNTRDTYPEQNLDNDLAQAVIAGNTIYLRGQVAQDLDTAENVGIGDPAAQTHRVMRNIDQLLRECGSDMSHVTKLVVYLVDIRHRQAVYRAMGEYIRGVHPVCTGLVVVALARPEWLVEIDATAVIPEEESDND